MRALLLATLLAHAAHASDAGTDAPTLGEFTPVVLDGTPLVDIREIEAGAAAPARGCWVDEPGCIAMAQRMTKAETELAELKKVGPKEDGGPPFLILLVAVVAGVALGAAGHAIIQGK